MRFRSTINGIFLLGLGVCLCNPASGFAEVSSTPPSLSTTVNHSLTSTQQIRTTKSISGVVNDETGFPIVGANVIEKGTTNGTTTDIDGKFTLQVAPGATIIISYIGYENYEFKVENKTHYPIKLREDSEALDEVVVVGFGTQRKSDLSGAVSQVSFDKVKGDRPVINTANALQGAIPGLAVTGGSSASQSKSFSIRGDLSINGGSPLVLIDNIESDISYINPDDIETITILKDASSAAIYGARAAGGVILITTKRPKNDARFNINYSFNQGWERSINRPQQASLDEYIAAYEEAGYSSQFWAGNGQISTWKELLTQYRNGQLQGVTDNGIYQHTDGAVYYLKESDVQGSILGTGAIANHNISVSGGTDKIRFRLSGNYSKNDGPLITNKDSYIRKTLNSFLSADIFKWFTQEANIYYTNTKSYSNANTIRDPYATRLNSWYPVSGNMPAAYLSGSDEDLPIDSPYNSLMLTPTAVGKNSIPRMQLTSIIKPLKDWSITAEYSYLQNDYSYSSYPGVLTYADVQMAVKTSPTDATKDTYTQKRSTTKRNIFNLYSNYAFSLGDHSFTVMGGYNQESYDYAYFAGSIQGQTVITVPSFGGGTGEKTLSESYSSYSSRSGFGRLTYNYDNRYLITLNGRYDGSSKFPKVSRFGFFPSGSVAWRVSQEKFMAPTTNWLSDLKIRASYGSIGNQNIDPYGYVASMSVAQGTTWLDGGNKITYISTPGLVRANYTWETVKTFDVGFDLGLLDNRLTAIFDWYRRSTVDMLSDGAELPSVVGASAPQQNVADMRTDGWELSVNWQDRINDWSYRIGFNLFDYKEKITKFNNATGSLSTWSEGYSIGSIWGYVSDGYYSIDDFDLEKAKGGVWELKEGIPSISGYSVRPGDCKFVDLDGDGVISAGASTVSNPGDRKVIGNNLPRYQFGANLGVSWKGFDLDVQLQGVGKRDYVLSGAALYPFSGAGADGVFQALYYNQTDYWTALSYDPEDPNYMVAANPHAKLFRIYGQEQNVGSNTRNSTAYLQSAAYMRVKNVTLAYTFPAKLLKPVQINGVRVYVSVENLATITSLPKGYDPENLSWAYPFYRTWSVGASLTF